MKSNMLRDATKDVESKGSSLLANTLLPFETRMSPMNERKKIYGAKLFGDGMLRYKDNFYDLDFGTAPQRLSQSPSRDKLVEANIYSSPNSLRPLSRKRSTTMEGDENFGERWTRELHLLLAEKEMVCLIYTI